MCSYTRKLDRHKRDSAWREKENKRKAALSRKRYQDPILRDKEIKRTVTWAANRRQSDPEYRKKERERQVIYERKRRQYDLIYRIKRCLRNRLYYAIKNGYKSGSAVQDLGCSIDAFKEYIAAKFEPWMTWDNWTKDTWHLDHIVPLAAFDLTDPEQLRRAFHYTNYQPLKASINVGPKRDKLDWVPSPNLS
jgi:hypothetical protein